MQGQLQLARKSPKYPLHPLRLLPCLLHVSLAQKRPPIYLQISDSSLGFTEPGSLVGWSCAGRFLLANVNVQRGRRSRVCQGDVFREVECIEYVTEKMGIVEVSKIVFPMIMVLTQDCDLEQDFGNRRKETQSNTLLSVLVAPLYNAEHVFQGQHLSDLGIRTEPINRKKSPGEFLVNNDRPRYHYLDFPVGTPVAPAVADFKHYFSVHVSYLERIRRKHFVCRLSDLFREDVCQRFSAYLGRIGLPA